MAYYLATKNEFAEQLKLSICVDTERYSQHIMEKGG